MQNRVGVGASSKLYQEPNPNEKMRLRSVVDPDPVGMDFLPDLDPKKIWLDQILNSDPPIPFN
jgi:hypothetical protein